jgi:Uma2 family endonuclease
MTVAIKRWRCSVHDYYRMLDSGILTEDSRVELIHGEIVEMAPIGSGHAAAVNCLTRRIVQAVGDRAFVSVQNPLRLDLWSEPQPDLLLLQPREDGYRARHPGPDDVLLVVEVSDSTLDYDRQTKLPLYAGAGVHEVWIVSLPDGAIEAYREPTGSGYGSKLTALRGDQIAPSLLPDVSIVVDDVIGPAVGQSIP